MIEDLQEIDKRFDIVVSSEVIEHVEEPWAFTAYCSNLVKEDGDLIMTTVNRTQVRSSTSYWSIMSMDVQVSSRSDLFSKTVESYQGYLLLSLLKDYLVFYRKERTNGKSS